MFDPAALTTLRLGDLFSGEFRPEPVEGMFAWEWSGGQYDIERVAGVKLFRPESSPAEAAAVEVSACDFADGYRLVSGRQVRGAFDAGWAANADRVLAAVGAPVRMGCPAADVEAMAAGPVAWHPFSGEADRQHFRCERGGLAAVGIASRSDGLLHLLLVRLDAVAANDCGI